jgi:hypothetical protein
MPAPCVSFGNFVAICFVETVPVDELTQTAKGVLWLYHEVKYRSQEQDWLIPKK